ncbi:MAG: protein phosphatase CheZ [Gammaproteobacteria bacterium]|uniref:protein phosphatase CheZ n=1 Tax=Luteimonas sp. JM171 TaxID=1896164 RepID=UPI000BA41773|nr:protein phosphatase CheZ [Luteimonas sp. JM171]NLC61558.1 protein phosphatase CheZ [Gammaproteobacteria bacterium]
MERGDEAAWRRRVQLLADSPARNTIRRLARLARELEQTLAALPPDPVPGRLDDAGARLDHVVAMTEQATHRTLDLIEDSRSQLARLQEGALDPAQAAIAATLRNNLKEMALAQSHQDLGGQTIRKVAGIVRRVHEQLAGIVDDGDNAAPAADAGGPAVEGVDFDRIDQSDADDLLSRMGL